MSEEQTTPETPKKKRRTKIIDDVPSDNDVFDSSATPGSHKRVANAIAELIQSDEQGGKMIGLEGGWGAGKSTVTNLLKDSIINKPNIGYFYFDTWAHEGDPLRRTFIESLIRYFQEKKWVNQLSWDDEIKTITKKRKIVNTRTVQKATILGKAFAISVLAIPIGTAFISNWLKEGIVIDPNLPFSISFLLGIFFCCMPLFVLGINGIRIIRRNKKRKKENAPVSAEEKLRDWAFLTGNAFVDSTQNMTEDPEQTSIEFEDTFRKLMTEALTTVPDRKCLIILDNLDRVDEKYALSIWSTLQTFLQDRSTKKEKWYERLWIVIPYDPDGLRKLWINQNSVQTGKAKEKSESIANSFIDKSFQLKFEVPPLVASDRKQYLLSLLKEALPDHTDADSIIEFNTIYRIFKLYTINDEKPPTPRQLKLFVNHIGAIHRQWQDVFPLSHVAYYVLLKRSYVDVAEALTKWDESNQKMESILGDKLKESLAGLTFNVLGNLGLQLVLKGPITSALTNNEEPSVLIDLYNKHGEGFWVIFEDIVGEDLPGFDTTTFAKASICLSDSKILENKSDNDLYDIRKTIKESAINNAGWVATNDTINLGLKAVCQIVNDSDFTNKMFGKSKADTGLIEPTQFEANNLAENLVEQVNSLFGFINQIGHTTALDKPYEVPITVDKWIQICPIIESKGADFWKSMVLKGTTNEIIEKMSSSVSAGTFGEVNHSCIRVSNSAFTTPPDWEKLARTIEGRLAVGNALQSKEVEILLNTLYLLKQFSIAEVNDILTRISIQGNILHWLDLANAEGNQSCKALCMVTYLSQSPAADAISTIGNSANGHATLLALLANENPDLANQVISVLRRIDDMPVLFSIAEARKDQDVLIRQCFQLVAESDDSKHLYSPSVVRDKWDHIIDYIDESRFTGLISRLCAETKLVEEIPVLEKDFNPDNSILYAEILNSINSSQFQDWCKSGLESLDTTKWESEIKHENDALNLLLLLLEKGVHVNLKNHFLDALVNHSLKVLKDEVKVTDNYKDKWPIVLSGIREVAIRNALAPRLLDNAMGLDGNCSDLFFELYKEDISNKEVLANKSKIVEKLFSPLVRKRKIQGVKWVNKVLEIFPDILSPYNGSDELGEFKLRLQEDLDKIEGIPEEIKDDIAIIAKSLGIEPTPIANEESEELQEETKPEGEVKNEDSPPPPAG